MIDFKERAKQLRRETLQLAIDTNNEHVAPAFSMIELLIAVYDHMGPEDKFILSKGHGCLSLYALLRQCGLNPDLCHHPDLDPENGIEATTGSLGHGLPIGLGMAMARKIRGLNGDIYVLVGDGECQEGTTWEAALLAAHHKLDNLTLIIDRNYLQALDCTEKILPLNSMWHKFQAFGWTPININGHCFRDINFALNARSKRPKAIIAETVKGKGLPVAEGNPKWHNYLPSGDELKECVGCLENS
jgi:transketolase